MVSETLFSSSGGSVEPKTIPQLLGPVEMWGRSSLLTLGLPAVIRCILRPSNELRRAMETLNGYIGGRRERGQTTDLRGIENS